MARLAALLIALAFSCVVRGMDAPPAAEDPKVEAHVMRLSAELRCLVCQNQTLADSNAPLALDLRDQVREQVKQGRSDEEIVDYLVARYGDFVRYRPPLKATTLILWFGPLLLVLSGGYVLARRLRMSRPATPAPLSESEHQRAAALLGEEKGR